MSTFDIRFGGSNRVQSRQGDLGSVLGELAGVLIDAFAGGNRAMSPGEFRQLKSAVADAAFDSSKVDVIRTAARHNSFTSEQVEDLLDGITFSDGKLQALAAVADKIVDPGQSFTILESFTFSSDKEKAQRILGGTEPDIGRTIGAAADALGRAIGGDGLAMNAQEFNQLKRSVKGASFDDDKVDVLRTAAPYAFFGAGQVRELLDQLSFSDGKLEALSLMADRIVDRDRAYTVLGAFNFSSDKEKARAILNRW